jgi:hypothetical protein
MPKLLVMYGVASKRSFCAPALAGVLRTSGYADRQKRLQAPQKIFADQ